MTQDLSKVHYKKCRYPSCNLTSRDGVPGLTFHAFPVRQADRCVKWLVNCGLDDWVEMSEKDLKLRYICSRHFSEDNFYATGRLKREAVPIILGLENPNLKTSKNACKVRKVVSTETDFLKKQIEKLETKLEKERQKRMECRAKLCATRVALSRLKSKLSEGTFQDIYLNKALANKLQGFVLTFIRMQLFHKQSTCYTTDEQRLCMMMHCISPALYSKMRDDFKFVLPNEITMVRWFNKLNISPKKASLTGSFNFEKREQSAEAQQQNNLITEDAPVSEVHALSPLNDFMETSEVDSVEGEQVEMLEDDSQRELSEEQFEALENERLETEIIVEEINQSVESSSEKEDGDLEYVTVDENDQIIKEKCLFVTCLEDKNGRQILTEVLDFNSDEVGDELKVLEELENVSDDFDTAQHIEESEQYIIELQK
ncbi:uncharacterized protein LOC122500025 [Leptopilina heterotoma]|uniref:uncharacterized protein LOC122500025 n=1 Tax=Leptopilina heterotoma TaxID=63436 RepID=UPI001CA924E2|nr:uncharacterized protein LOC122500025 [Leptopilina heterotoma]XP_043464638.1 uncharacterized protein LOC122500025 [Leptopilina heterotoma]